MKKFVSCLLAFAMLTCLYSPAFALESKLSGSNRVEESIMENAACEQYSNLMTSFSELYGDSYPAFYAGAYINDSHALVIKTTPDITDKDLAWIKECAKSQDVIIDASAEYSLNDLLILQERIEDYYCANYNSSSIASEINSISVINEENAIKVGVQNLTPAFEEAFLSEIAQGMSSRHSSVLPISLIEERAPSSSSSYAPIAEPTAPLEDTMVTASIEVNPGEGIGVKLKNGKWGGGLIGFPASRRTSSGTEYGFVTAAHLLLTDPSWTEGTTSYLCYDAYNQLIGTMVYTKFSGSVDAGFVKCSSTTSCGHSIYTGVTLYEIQGYGSAPEGTTVAAMNQDGEIVYGEISSTNRNISVDGKTIKDVYNVSGMSLREGDSGGPLFRHFGYESVIVLGILSGGSSRQQHFCKVSNILSGLNVSFM